MEQYRREDFFGNVRRVVVKVGSGVLTRNNGLNLDVISEISSQIHLLQQRNVEVILVSSGAMAAGVKRIGLPSRPEDIPGRQAVAAVGQAGLIMEYEKTFEGYGRQVAQVLLTRGDLCNRARYLNARNTLYTLLEWGVLPIVNENDTVAVEELKFGDNDNLGAMITLLLDADVMINLTDIDGLYDSDPRVNPDAKLMREVRTIGRGLEKVAGEIPGALGTGGMLSKIKAARKLNSAGVPMVIAKGLLPGIISDIFAGKDTGTFFLPRKEKLSSRKKWIGFTLKPMGRLVIDGGAAEAVIKRNTSLLPSGIVAVHDQFGKGSPVEFVDVNGDRLGMGLVNYSSADIQKIMGAKTSQIKSIVGSKPYDEVIHRDNLVVTKLEADFN